LDLPSPLPKTKKQSMLLVNFQIGIDRLSICLYRTRFLADYHGF
jgi:hypothetical protein